MSTTDMHLLQLKIQDHLQKTRTLNAGTLELIRKSVRNLHSLFAILSFIIKLL